MNLSKILVGLLATILVCSTNQSTAPPPNIQYLQRGYHIYYGNPLPSQGSVADPGFRTYFIFDLEPASSDSSDAFDMYTAIEGVNIMVGQDCVITASTSQFNNMQSYSQSLSVSASVETGFIFGSFSLSSEYMNLQSAMSSAQQSSYLMEGNCTVYEATVTGPSRLSKHFIEAALAIDPSNITSYYDFFNNYGTHYVTQLTMGAKVSVLSVFDANALQTFQSQGISVNAAMQMGFDINFGINGGLSTNTDGNSSLSSESSYTQVITIGSPPPTNGGSWGASIEEPLPISYQLSSIADLFTSSYFSDAADLSLLNQISENMQLALDTYYPTLMQGYPFIVTNNCSYTVSILTADQDVSDELDIEPGSSVSLVASEQLDDCVNSQNQGQVIFNLCSITEIATCQGASYIVMPFDSFDYTAIGVSCLNNDCPSLLCTPDAPCQFQDHPLNMTSTLVITYCPSVQISN